MQYKIHEQGAVSRCADYLMTPIMYLLQGTLREYPQRTHRWNNQKLEPNDIQFLDSEMMVTITGQPSASSRWRYILPIFHMPIFGGWRNYVVLTPDVKQDKWFVGWVAGDEIGVSRISLDSSVRMLQGPHSVSFFGINEHGNQIQISDTGTGRVGRAVVEHQHIPLL